MQAALDSDEAEMVAVIGRRRVGKTFLVNQIYDGHLVYSITGTQHAPLKEQLGVFAHQLNEYAKVSLPFKTPTDWMEAFQMLIGFLKEKIAAQPKRKPVIFLDELPWVDTHKSGFLRALSFFWNNFAVRQRIVVVICGSAA